ncbi:hypothetical protein DIE03_23050 [Burkholderia sp. Bp8992]|nr:hypothetical protein DIE03_23050 [Burkholderia sp. Bp8992]
MTRARIARTYADCYVPVKYTAADTAHLLADPTIKAAYDELEAKFAALRAQLAENQPGLISCDNQPR